MKKYSSLQKFNIIALKLQVQDDTRNLRAKYINHKQAVTGH